MMLTTLFSRRIVGGTVAARTTSSRGGGVAAVAVASSSSSSFSTLLDRAMRQNKLAEQRQCLNDALQQGSSTTNNVDPAMAIFDEIDINRDGVISREEFKIAIEKMRHLDLQRMKRTLTTNDIAFNYKGAALGRHVVITDKFNAWQYIKNLPNYDDVKHFSPPISLPPKKANAPKYTLVLDMDETLLHCSPEIDDETMAEPDHTFEVHYQGSTFPVHAWLRPGLKDFLDKVHTNFEVVIFTASQPQYANEILNILDPEGKYFHHRLFRNACMNVEGSYVKDLTVLDRDLSTCMLVDNSPHVFGYNLDNGIPISSWYDDKQDNELEKLEWFLRFVVEGDVRQQIRETFQCYKLVDNAAGTTMNGDNNMNETAAGAATGSEGLDKVKAIGATPIIASAPRMSSSSSTSQR